MSIRRFHYLILLAIIIAIWGLFTVKNRVSTLNYQLSCILKQINDESNNIHILKAEKAYLVSPERLRKLNQDYLALEIIKSSQMLTDPLAPVNDIKMKFDSVAVGKTNKWRYKSIMNTKYVRTVSSRK